MHLTQKPSEDFPTRYVRKIQSAKKDKRYVMILKMAQFAGNSMWFNRKKYRVKLQGRAGLIYEENGRSMFVDSEMLAGPDFDIVIYMDNIKPCDQLDDIGLVNEEEMTRIKGNITKYLSRFRIDWK